MSSTDFLSRDELLSGLVAKRARTLLYIIESRTAHLVAQDHLAANPFLDGRIARDREMAYLAAFSQGKQPPRRPTLQELERLAPQWELLAPETPRLRAALAHCLAEKYPLPRAEIPNIRQALRLDAPETAEAYQRLYGQPLTALYAARLGVPDRLRWAWSRLAGRLENLPPFWSAFAMTLTETIGASILALPLTVASVGPLAGLALLVFFGLVNVVTVGCMAESVLRNGPIRFGHAYIGRVVEDFLGRPGSAALSAGTFVFCLLVLSALFVGFAASLASVTPLPATVWVAALFALAMVIVWRQAIGATLASALVIGAVNMALLLAISLLALGHLDLARFTAIAASPAGQPFDAAILGAIFGVIGLAYCGHLSVGTYARNVIRRDPGGRSMTWGSTAAMLVAILVYLMWTAAIIGAVDRRDLLSEAGTVLAPLTRVAGGTVGALGTVYVILGLGFGAVQTAYSLYELTCERLPRHETPIITLPRRRGRIVLQAGRRSRITRLALVYLGVDDSALRLRLDVESGGRTQRHFIAPGARWDAAQFAPLELGRDRLALEVLRSSAENISLRINTTLALTYEGEWDTAGLDMAQVLELGEAEQRMTTWMMRQGGVSPAQLAAHLGQTEDQARELLLLMVGEGLITVAGEPGRETYRVLLSPKRGRHAPSDIWSALDRPAETSAASPPPGRLQPAARRIANRLASGPGRAVLSVTPLILSFLLAEWTVLTGEESYADLLGLIGVVITPLISGLFPVLLLIASRRKGDYAPAAAYRVLGNPLVLGFIYSLSLASLLVHGLIIWEEPLRRLAALATAGGMVALTVVMIRRGMFAPRTVVRVCDDQRQGQSAEYGLVSAGRPLTASSRLAYAGREEQVKSAGAALPDFPALQRIVIDLPARATREIKIWAQRVTPLGESEPLHASAEVRAGETGQVDLAAAGGQALLPDSGAPCQVQIDIHAQD